MSVKIESVRAADSLSQGAELDVVMIGAGFAGLFALYHLRGLGLAVRTFEAGDSVGGTWYWNRYPGARVDVESVEYAYSFSDELQAEWIWTERYAAQPELLRYANHVADRFNLRPDIQLRTRVTSAKFDEENARWRISTEQGDQITARFLVAAAGFISAPNIPDIDGLDGFRGDTYHTAAWPVEGVDLSGQRVGVIGTGSSGIQSIPIIAQQAKHLHVFQRTPNFSIPLRNRPMDPDVLRHIRENYEQWRTQEALSFAGHVLINSMPAMPQTKTAMEVAPEVRLADYEYRWESGGLGYYNSFPDIFTSREANETLAEFVRAKTKERIKNPKLAELLTPSGYPILGKRLCADTGYYETYERDNVTLVDLKRTPIKRITPAGIRVDGQEIVLDALVFATGFDAVTGALTRIDIQGVGGECLADHWAHGPKTYLGMTVAGFPNFFMVNGPHSPAAFFAPILLAEHQSRWIGDCIMYLDEHQIVSIVARPAVEEEWCAHVNGVADGTIFPQAASWYMGDNIPGKTRASLMYVGGFPEYSRRYEEVAADAYLSFDLTPKGA